MHRCGAPLPKPYGPGDMHYDGYFLAEKGTLRRSRTCTATSTMILKPVQEFGHKTRRAIYNQFFNVPE